MYHEFDPGTGKKIKIFLIPCINTQHLHSVIIKPN